MTEGIPQIISIVPVSPDGKMNLDEDVKQYLRMKGSLFLDIRDEVLPSVEKRRGDRC